LALLAGASAGVDDLDGDQGDAEIADLVQQAVERGLV